MAVQAVRPGEFSFPDKVRNPFRIALAIWRVMGDMTRTDEAGIVEIGFARSRFLRRFARWNELIERLRAEPVGRDAFAAQRRLGWIDVEALSRLPSGSLGAVYAAHLRACGLDPNLVKIPVEDDVTYLLAHLYESHDVWHVVSGSGNDEAGEFAVAGFYVAQLGAPFFAFLLGLVFLNTAFRKPGQLQTRMEALAKGYLCGKGARPLFGVDWSALWSLPIEDVRRTFGIEPRPYHAGQGILDAAA